MPQWAAAALEAHGLQLKLLLCLGSCCRCQALDVTLLSLCKERGKHPFLKEADLQGSCSEGRDPEIDSD